MLNTSEVAELLGRTATSVRVLLHRRGAADEGGLLREGRAGLLAGTIPEPAMYLGVSPGWDEFEILRYRAYLEAGRMAERAEHELTDARTVSDDDVIVRLCKVLQYPVTDEFLDRLVSTFDSEVS